MFAFLIIASGVVLGEIIGTMLNIIGCILVWCGFAIIDQALGMSRHSWSLAMCWIYVLIGVGIYSAFKAIYPMAGRR